MKLQMTTLAQNYDIPLTRTDQVVYWLSRHWMGVVSTLVGIITLTPFLAPVFMTVGWTGPGRVIYFIYSFLCHQLPERSYFFFGPKLTYSFQEIRAAWQDTDNIIILRQFIGNAQMGWKTAWSDRMVSMYISLWLSGIFWGIMRKRIKPLPWWGLVLFLLPMAVDGFTHLFSDLHGFGLGFRYTNDWLAVLTHNSLLGWFYLGDAWGSFNAWMRLMTGILFGLGVVWFGFPYLEEAFNNSVLVIDYKYQQKRLLLTAMTRLTGTSAQEVQSASGVTHE
jgi:uncharacterized membrane protein